MASATRVVDFVDGVSRIEPDAIRDLLVRKKTNSAFRPMDAGGLVVFDLHDVAPASCDLILDVVNRSARILEHSMVVVTETPAALVSSVASMPRVALLVARSVDAMRVLLPGGATTFDPLGAALDRAAQRYRWSSQQRTIVQLCAEGVSLKCVGDRIGVSHETVKTQLSRLRKKAHAPDTESLVMEILHDAVGRRAR